MKQRHEGEKERPSIRFVQMDNGLESCAGEEGDGELIKYSVFRWCEYK